MADSTRQPGYSRTSWAPVRRSYALLLEEAHDTRAIASGLRADLGRRLDAIEARLPQGPSVFATSEDELTMLVMRVRDEASTESAEASRLTATRH